MYRRSNVALASSAVMLTLSVPAHASLFSGDTLDFVANILSWIVLFLAPIIAIGVFLMVHIMPEKIAEKRKHPQLSAIKTLCLLSLFFGGMLWPLAWLWAYSKPVLYKMAYGTDAVDHEETHAPSAPDPGGDEPQPPTLSPASAHDLRREV
jgi:CBS domain containing-hemolysin-like protein